MKPTEGHRSGSYLTRGQMFQLDNACAVIRKTFDVTPYLVGSVHHSPDYRDVDVRLMLKDEDYDTIPEHIVLLLGVVISQWMTLTTRLPIDFQIQRTSEANEKHKGWRNPLGMRSVYNFPGDT